MRILRGLLIFLSLLLLLVGIGIRVLVDNEPDIYTLDGHAAELGIEVDINEDNIMKIRGGKIHPAQTFSHDDHRIAMSLAITELRLAEPLNIKNRECVSKSYPSFFDDLELLKAGANEQ